MKTSSRPKPKLGRDARLKCPQCGRICTGAQGLAAHKRNAHRDGGSPSPSPVEEADTIVRELVQPVDSHESGEFVPEGIDEFVALSATGHLDRAVEVLTEEISHAAAEVERLEELRASLGAKQAQLQALQEARAKFQ